MEFSRIGKHTIKCVISEAEVEELGFSMEDVIGNGERTQEFMNHIFDLAEQKFQTKFDLGVKTVRADFMPDHTLSLTFSEHPASNGMAEHLKDIVNGLLGSASKEQEKTKTVVKEPDLPIMVGFVEMDDVIRYSKQMLIRKAPPSALYKFEDNYYLDLDFENVDDEDIKIISVLTDEYSSDILLEDGRRAFIIEHGKNIISKNAIEKLSQF